MIETKKIINTILKIKDEFKVSNIVMADMLFKIRSELFQEEETGFQSDFEPSKDHLCLGYKKSYKRIKLLAPKGEWSLGEKNKLYLNDNGAKIFNKLSKSILPLIESNEEFKLLRFRYLERTAQASFGKQKIF